MGAIRGPDSDVSATEIEAAADAIGRGEVVAYPTETYYALGADPRKPHALDEVLRLKGRDARDGPLLVLVSARTMVADFVSVAPPAFEPLAERFWPGPLTLVLPAAPALPDAITGRTGGVALRLTSHPVARALIDCCGVALTGTSANRSGQPPASNVARVREAFGADLPHILDGGETPGGLPSTLLDLTGERPAVLRPGAVPEAEIDAVVRLL